MKIREFLPADLDRILEISRASFSQPWPKGEFEICYQKYPEEFVVAEDRGEIIGFIVGKISDKTGVVKLIAVDRNYQKTGVGKNLMEFLLKDFKEKGARTVLARTRAKNEVGIAFLKNFGFEIAETVENYYPNDDNAYLMGKNLGE